MSAEVETPEVQTPPAPERKRFSLRRKIREYEIELDSGEVKVYELVEMTAKMRDSWIQSNQNRVVKDKGGTKVSNLDGFQASLLQLCLREKGSTSFVTFAQLQEFPASVQSEIFDDAQEDNGLGDKSAKQMREDAKKD